MADHWTGLDAAFAELEAECTQIVRGMTVKIFSGILSKTPQYLGRMAASWTYSLNAPEYVDRSSSVDPEAEKLAAHRYTQFGAFKGLYRGHPLAIAVANQANSGRDAGFRLGMTVFLSNGVNHGEGAYSQDTEDGNVVLRAENRPGAPVSRTLDWAGIAFRNVSPQVAISLKNLRIGRNEPS
jgi:hypothetical protein